MAGSVSIRVHGDEELARAFLGLSSDVKRQLKPELVAAGEGVRGRAEDMAVSNIRNIGARWSRMRIGATTRLVYVAPKTRRSGGSPRPNLAPLLLNRAMEPALDEQAPEVYGRIELMLDRLADENGFL